MKTLISLATKKAKEKGIEFDKIELSPLKNKKLRIYLKNGKHVDFGSATSQTYLEDASENKRKGYIARHSQIYLKDGRRAIDIEYSPSWLSFHILWD